MAASKATAPKAPAFDASALTVQDAELPKQTRSGNAGPNPFLPVLTASKDHGNAGKSVNVPAGNVGQVQYLIRRAAADLGVGSRIVLRNSKGDTLDKAALKSMPKTAQVTVLFASKARKQSRKGAATA
jgi:hypothetical protein